MSTRSNNAPDLSHDHDHDHAHHAAPGRLMLYSPAGVVASAAALRLAARRLRKHGYAVDIDASALARHQRFAGDDDTRLAAVHRVAAAAPSVALASRGGYGWTRLLDRVDWAAIARSIEQGTRWVGHSDYTAMQMALMKHVPRAGVTWAGPLACADFGRADADGGVDDVTEACFLEAMSGELEAVGFRTEAGFDGLDARGTLWGGNLCVLTTLLGTRHWPRVRGGILYLEDVNEHPYRVERMLLQLHQAGVLDEQRAVVLGAFTDYKPSPLDRGYTLKTAVSMLRSVCKAPVLTGLPFGHVATKVCLPVGARVTLAVQDRDAYIGWAG